MFQVQKRSNGCSFQWPGNRKMKVKRGWSEFRGEGSWISFSVVYWCDYSDELMIFVFVVIICDEGLRRRKKLKIRFNLCETNKWDTRKDSEKLSDDEMGCESHRKLLSILREFMDLNSFNLVNYSYCEKHQLFSCQLYVVMIDWLQVICVSSFI